MAELSVQRSASQSSIPVVTPRPSRSSISSTFPLSQTSLVSQLRRKSESTHQHPPALPSVPSALPPVQSSIPSFRSIRNLLPFAPAKTNPPTCSTHISRPSIVNFGSLRRIGNDKKNWATHTHAQEAEETPVIAIARPSENFEEEMMARKRSRDVNRSASETSPSPTSEEHYVLPLPSSGPPLGADLSTIIEAENSGISKHIPCLGDGTQGNDDDDDTPTSPFNLDKCTSLFPSPGSREASIFDLSTSKLAMEVMDALKVEDVSAASEWLKGMNGIVVEGDIDEPDPVLGTPGVALGNDEDPETALDFGALDPDLAQLLSPNRINGQSQIPSPLPSRLPSPIHLRNSSHPVPNPSLHPSNNEIPPRPSPSPRLGLVIPPSVSSAAIQSSPSRRTVSLSRANPTRGTPSSLPRLMRSVTTTPLALATHDSSPETSTSPRLRGPPKKRHQPPSPLSSQSHSSQGPSSASSRGSTDMPPRRLTGSRLATPNRHVSSYAPGNSRLADPSSTNEKALLSQFSPRSASDPTRQPNLRPSLEFGGSLEVNKRRRPHLFSSRRRSMSVEEARLSPTSGSTSPIRPSSSLSNRPPAMEWLGPRTVKAFAAAGLLDGDRDGHGSGTNKYGSLRTHSEREDRFAPSRMAFSEVASTSSWGRSGSVSRGVTPSEGGVTWGSPTFSAPRTTFSGSTAPTSISATSSQQAAIQMMKEKHDIETEALLSALSDSQRTTKTLREENLQLRDRIRELEDELGEMRTHIHQLASGMLSPPTPPPGPFSRSPHDRSLRLLSPLAPSHRPPGQRPLSHVHSNGFTKSVEDRSPSSSRATSPSRDSPAPVTVAAPRPRRRRASTTSSVFPNVPQNMSLLMLEETMHDRTGPSSMPPSPTLTSSMLQRSSLCNGTSGMLGHVAHVHTHVSSGTRNISPTIASFSLTEIPGSPSSLQLRPEHEMHLGDMATLSLYAMSDEEL